MKSSRVFGESTSGGWLLWIIVLTCWSIEFQSMILRSTFTPPCLVYCSDKPCPKGFVWSLLYSAITTVIDLPPPDRSAPRSHAPSRSVAPAPSAARAVRARVIGRVPSRRSRRPRRARPRPHLSREADNVGYFASSFAPAFFRARPCSVILFSMVL